MLHLELYKTGNSVTFANKTDNLANKYDDAEKNLPFRTRLQHLTPVELKKCSEWTALEQCRALLPVKALRCVRSVELRLEWTSTDCSNVAFLYQQFGFSLSLPFHQCSTVISIFHRQYMALNSRVNITS